MALWIYIFTPYTRRVLHPISSYITSSYNYINILGKITNHVFPHCAIYIHPILIHPSFGQKYCKFVRFVSNSETRQTLSYD
jgi:hypothetical protein